MKKIIKVTLIAAALVFSIEVYAQPSSPPTPNGGNSPGGGNTPVGGGAPIGSGLTISLLLAAAYAGKKTFGLKAEDKQ